MGLKLKLQLYESGVCSMATHAFEAWKLSDANMKALQLWNAKRLAFITGRSFRQEYKYPSFNLVAALRVRRLRWLGHVLRMEEGIRDVRTVMTQMCQPYPEGSLFMDAPQHRHIDQLITMAEVKKKNGIYK